MPVSFWNDPDGRKYHAAYFELPEDEHGNVAAGFAGVGWFEVYKIRRSGLTRRRGSRNALASGPEPSDGSRDRVDRKAARHV